jgi:hypothetical protein
VGLAGSVTATASAAGLYAFGGFSLRWPMALSFASFWLVGPVLDSYVAVVGRVGGSADHRRAFGRGWAGLVALLLAGVAGNLAHLGGKLALGVLRQHATLWGLPSGVYECVTYCVFGMAAGLVAWGITMGVGRGGSPPRSRV